MDRDYDRYERHERRGFGGRDTWDDEGELGIYPDARDRLTNRSGWQDARQVNWGGRRDDRDWRRD